MRRLIRKHGGFSLIEMMVSLVLGLFLVGGITTMYLSSKKSDQLRNEVSEVEANARLALGKLRQIIEHAGYKSMANIPLDKPFQTPSDGNIENAFCSDGLAMVTNPVMITPTAEIAGYTRDQDSGDLLTIAYRADHPNSGTMITDCNGDAYTGLVRQISCSADTENGGMANPWDSRIYNTFYLHTDDLTGEKSLMCHGSRGDAPSVIADNIENLQFRYGVTTGGNTTYKNATQVEANNEWESVTSVQVALLVRSNDKVDQDETKTFQLLDKSITKTDQMLYRDFTTTINLPNRSRRALLVQ